MAIGAAKESARNHITTIITLATRFEVWALEQTLRNCLKNITNFRFKHKPLMSTKHT